MKEVLDHIKKLIQVYTKLYIPECSHDGSHFIKYINNDSFLQLIGKFEPKLGNNLTVFINDLSFSIVDKDKTMATLYNGIYVSMIFATKPYDTENSYHDTNYAIFSIIDKDLMKIVDNSSKGYTIVSIDEGFDTIFKSLYSEEYHESKREENRLMMMHYS